MWLLLSTTLHRPGNPKNLQHPDRSTPVRVHVSEALAGVFTYPHLWILALGADLEAETTDASNINILSMKDSSLYRSQHFCLVPSHPHEIVWVVKAVDLVAVHVPLIEDVFGQNQESQSRIPGFSRKHPGIRWDEVAAEGESMDHCTTIASAIQLEQAAEHCEMYLSNPIHLLPPPTYVISIPHFFFSFEFELKNFMYIPFFNCGSGSSKEFLNTWFTPWGTYKSA